MMGPAGSRDGKLFHVGFHLEDRLPQDHPLRQIDRVVDFAFVRPMVAALYGYNGHVSLDPALLLRLLFLCFYENVRSERELLRQLPLRLDWMWFCRLDLDSVIPDHSVLSKARRRWGERTFERVFAEVVKRCQEAGLLEGKTVHADSTLLRANASLEGRVSRVLWEQLEQATTPRADAPPAYDAKRADAPTCGTDTDAAPACENNAAKDNAGDDNSRDGHKDDAGDADSGDGGLDGGLGVSTRAKTAARLNDRLVSPVDPDAATSTRRAGGTTLGYRDHRLIDDRCGIILASVATPADRDDGVMLEELLMRQRDYSDTMPREVVGDSMYGTADNYTLLHNEGIKAYLKKRRGKDSPKTSWLKLLPASCSPSRALHLLGRRKSRAEGSFAEAHVRMNHRRCRWRRRPAVQIQCYLVAMVQNLKKLAKHHRRAIRLRDLRGITTLMIDLPAKWLPTPTPQSLNDQGGIWATVPPSAGHDLRGHLAEADSDSMQDLPGSAAATFPKLRRGRCILGGRLAPPGDDHCGDCVFDRARSFAVLGFDRDGFAHRRDVRADGERRQEQREVDRPT